MSKSSDTPRPSGSVAGTARRAAGKLRRLAGQAAPAPTPAPAASAEPSPEVLDRVRRQAARPGERVLRAWTRVGRQVLGEEVFPEGVAPRFDPATAKLMTETAARQRGLSVFGQRLAEGASLETAAMAAVRDMTTPRSRHHARALVLGLASQPGGERIEALGLGLVTYSMGGNYEGAWERFKALPVEVLAEHVPVEAVSCALRIGTPETVAVALAVADRASAHDVTTLVELAGRFVATQHLDVARALVAEIERRDAADLTDRDTVLLSNVRRWTHPAPVEEPPAGAVRFGVIDYHQPDFDRSSKNVGDYVQTLAMLGNLARFQKARFTGPGGLGELATTLQGRVKPELRRDTGDADVHLMPVSRDFSEGDAVPENTWMLAFGWHMHSMFRIRFGLPYHPNINPVFVSFHVNKTDALTPEAIDYLKAHGPIGCRDWTTVYLLLSAGVDAFFTGCLTTTVNAVFPDIEDVEREQPGVVAVIDLPTSAVKKAKRPVEWITHGDVTYRHADLVEGTYHAIELLEDYQKRFHRIVTSRLHSYLPATSLGVNVKFAPHIPGDVRFDGLYGMKPGKPEFVAMRDGIRELITSTFEKVFAGESSEDVYAHWREVTADRVAAAKERFHAPAPQGTAHVDVPAVVAEIRDSLRRYGPHDAVDETTVTDVAMSLDQNFAPYLPVTVESMLANASGPVRLWVTARGLSKDYEDWFSRSFPNLPVTFLNFDHVDYGDIGRMIMHISIATMDRLLLPEVLDHLDRITYVDIDTVSEGDVCELGATDLHGTPLAARTSVYSGAVQWRQAGDLLSPEKAADLRRTMSARHPFDFHTFNAGVLVLDLARMRADKFVDNFLPLAAEYGLNDQDVLNAYVGGDRADLDQKWNRLPVMEPVENPGVVHFAGAGKPWDSLLVPYGDHWKTYADRVAARIGTPPA